MAPNKRCKGAVVLKEVKRRKQKLRREALQYYLRWRIGVEQEWIRVVRKRRRESKRVIGETQAGTGRQGAETKRMDDAIAMAVVDSIIGSALRFGGTELSYECTNWCPMRKGEASDRLVQRSAPISTCSVRLDCLLSAHCMFSGTNKGCLTGGETGEQ